MAAPEDKTGLHVVIISRKNCFRCKEIQQTLDRDKVPSIVIYIDEGGAAFLGKYNFVPEMLPATMLFREKELLGRASGLSGFMEYWEGEEE